MKRTVIIALLILAASCSTNNTPFTLADPFVDGCVLAKDKPIPVFGTGGGFVGVKLCDDSGCVCRSRTKAQDGRWDAVLPATGAGGPYVLKVTSGFRTLSVRDVYVGRVILLGGQSNLQFKLKDSNTPPSEWKSDSLLREYTLPRLEEGEPYSPADGWIRCTGENAGDWSAIGYLTGAELRKATGEAVSVINCYQGASVIEAWLPEDVALKPEYSVPDDKRQGDFLCEYYWTWNKPGTLYREALGKIVPYAVSDVVWYQGESNTGEGEVAIYQDLFGELLKSWRGAFNDPTLPFVVIQLADHDTRGNEHWHRLQDIQAGLSDVYEGVTCVPCKDVCESNDIHPKSKAVLSRRIAEAILLTGE